MTISYGIATARLQGVEGVDNHSDAYSQGWIDAQALMADGSSPEDVRKLALIAQLTESGNLELEYAQAMYDASDEELWELTGLAVKEA